MTGRPMMLVLAGALMLAPLALAQDHAVSRGGGGGGDSKGGGGGGGHPGVSSSGGGDSGSSYKPSSSGSGSGYSPSSTAEQRHPRAGTGRGDGRHYGPYSYPYNNSGYYYYSPSWGWGSYWWPYGSYGWYGGYWGYPWGWGSSSVYHYVHREAGSIRVLVDPAEARVYVDGYYAGTVDDFDGLFQRLNVSPGRHEIALKLEGYKTHRIKVYAAPGRTLKLHHDMVRGAGETVEDLGGNAPEREVRRERERDGEEGSAEDEDAAAQADDAARPAGGKLRLNVRPSDASVYLDGAFRGTAREAASLKLSAGHHRLEVVRPGYRTLEREIEIAPGESTEISVELEKPSI
jgi:hypothetical protein